jgi:plastocyanin
MIFCGMKGIMFKAGVVATPIRERHVMKIYLAIAVVFGIAAALSAPLLGAAKPAKGVTHSVSIKGMKFAPVSLTIKAGDSVKWDNGDQRDHTVVAADGSFNSGNIGPGGNFSFTFAKAGKYEYACSLHPRMKGVVIVQ